MIDSPHGGVPVLDPEPCTPYPPAYPSPLSQKRKAAMEAPAEQGDEDPQALALMLP